MKFQTPVRTPSSAHIRFRYGSSSKLAWKTNSVLLGVPPTTLTEAAQKLAAATGCDPERCQAQLILISKPASERGGTGDRAFLDFKLHQLFSGAGCLDSTLRELGRRKLTLGGQLFEPQDDEARLCITTKMAQKQLEKPRFWCPP